MSEHQPVPRVVPILGSTDYHLAVAVLARSVVSGVGGRRAQASCGRRYTSPLIIMAQMTRAILLASATAASFFGLRASNPKSHGEARPLLARWMTAVAPSMSSGGHVRQAGGDSRLRQRRHGRGGLGEKVVYGR